MKLYIMFNKKNLAAITAAIIIVLVVIAQFASARSVFIDGSSNALRVQYLKSIGYDVISTSVISKEIIIPLEFSDVYAKYNSLQKKAGFDLNNYKGKKAITYKYNIYNNDKTYIDVIVCNGIIIGGDIADVSINGEMKPLM